MLGLTELTWLCDNWISRSIEGLTWGGKAGHDRLYQISHNIIMETRISLVSV